MRQKRDFVKSLFLLTPIFLPFEGYSLNYGSISLSVPLIFIIIISFFSLIRVFLIGYLKGGWFYVLLILTAGVFSCISGIYFGVPISKLTTSLLLITILIIFFISISQINFEKSKLDKLIKIIINYSCILAVIGLYQVIANNTSLPDLYFRFNNPVIGGQKISVLGTFVRPTSVFAEPSWLGHYMLFSFFLLLGHKEYFNKKRYNIYLIILILSIIFSLSFGTFLLWAITVLAFKIIKMSSVSRRHFTNTKNTKRILVPIVLLFIAFGLIFRNFITMFLNALVSRINIVIDSLRLYSSSSTSFVRYDSVTMRLSLSILGAKMFVRFPVLSVIFGAGIGGFQYALAKYFSYTFGYSGFGWTNLLVEQGIFGLFAYLIFMLNLVISFIKLSLDSHYRTYYSEINSFILILLMLFFDGFTGGLGFERSILIWFLFTLSFIYYKALREEVNKA